MIDVWQVESGDAIHRDREGVFGRRWDTENRMKRISVTAIALARAASATYTRAAAIEYCPAPPGTVKVALPSGLPPALREAMGDVALPGEPFDEIDVYVQGHKHSRYIFVWNVGNRWIVATEHGGIALRAIVSTYALDKDGRAAKRIEERITFPESVCSTATSLAGHRNQVGGQPTTR